MSETITRLPYSLVIIIGMVEPGMLGDHYVGYEMDFCFDQERNIFGRILLQFSYESDVLEIMLMP